MKALQILSLGVVLYFIAISSSATSCVRMSNEYYLLCSQGVCSEGIESFEIRSTPYCSRKSEIGDAPDWMLRFTEKVLASKKHDIGDGIIKVVELRHYGLNKRADNFEEFLAAKLGIKSGLPNDKIEPEELFEILMSSLEKTNKDWFTLHSGNVNSEALDELAEQLKGQASDEALKAYANWVIQLVLLVILVLTFIWSINCFYSRLYNRKQTSVLSAVKLPFTIQFMLLLSPMPMSLMGLFSFTVLAFTMLIPAIFFIILAESVQLILLKFRKS